MKKITLMIAAAMVALSASAAYTLNNPVGADGRYIVKYNCEQGTFATSNDIEADETFTFAIDVTGTWLENWLKDTPTAEGASRGVAFNNWTGYGDTNSDFRRLKQISGNIYGATVNFAQVMVNEELKGNAVMTDSVLYVYAQIFGFEYTADNAGAGWWMWNDNDVDEYRADGADCLFAFAPYTGTKTSEPLYSDDYTNGDIFGYAVTGYAAPCAVVETAVEDINADLKVVAVEYYNILGTRLNEAPEYGVYVKTAILENGKRVSEKVFVK